MMQDRVLEVDAIIPQLSEDLKKRIVVCSKETITISSSGKMRGTYALKSYTKFQKIG